MLTSLPSNLARMASLNLMYPCTSNSFTQATYALLSSVTIPSFSSSSACHPYIAVIFAKIPCHDEADFNFLASASSSPDGAAQKLLSPTLLTQGIAVVAIASFPFFLAHTPTHMSQSMSKEPL